MKLGRPKRGDGGMGERHLGMELGRPIPCDGLLQLRLPKRCTLLESLCPPYPSPPFLPAVQKAKLNRRFAALTCGVQGPARSLCHLDSEHAWGRRDLEV